MRVDPIEICTVALDAVRPSTLVEACENSRFHDPICPTAHAFHQETATSPSPDASRAQGVELLKSVALGSRRSVRFPDRSGVRGSNRGCDHEDHPWLCVLEGRCDGIVEAALRSSGTTLLGLSIVVMSGIPLLLRLLTVRGSSKRSAELSELARKVLGYFAAGLAVIFGLDHWVRRHRELPTRPSRSGPLRARSDRVACPHDLAARGPCRVLMWSHAYVDQSDRGNSRATTPPTPGDFT